MVQAEESPQACRICGEEKSKSAPFEKRKGCGTLSSKGAPPAIWVLDSGTEEIIGKRPVCPPAPPAPSTQPRA